MAAFFSLMELVHALVLTLAAGYIFMDFFKRPADDDPVKALRQQSDWQSRLLYASAIVAPAIILHELGHKFVAMGYGLDATFSASYVGLAIAVIVKVIGFPFVIFVPAFVRILGEATPGEYAVIAFAGPAVNLLLWLVAWLVLRTVKLPKNHVVFWTYAKYINGFLFIFNMIPLWNFDGSKVLSGVLAVL